MTLSLYLFIDENFSLADMIAATSVLQQQASDIRTQKINWQSYNQSQMISNEDYQCISTLDSDKKHQYLKDQAYQAAKTYLNLLSHVSKDTTIQYLLVMIDDMLTVSCETCDFSTLLTLEPFTGRPF
jgi:V-type H+-transporting ATPase subunit H